MSSGEPEQYIETSVQDDPGATKVQWTEINERGDFHDQQASLLDLPWDDVIFTYILNRLHIPELFHLRRVSQQFNELIMCYFSVMKDLNIARIAGKMNHEAFELLTSQNTNLHSLNLRNSKGWLKDATLMSVLKSNPKLQSLDLTYCNSLSNGSMQVLAMNCPRLKTLVLRDCPWLSTEGLTVVALNCDQLEKLDVAGCWNVTDDAIIIIAQSCKRLQSVTLSNLYGLSDNALSILARNCSENLHHLNIQGCWRITDDSVRFLGKYCSNLKILQVRECRNVTERTLSKLRENGVRMDKRPPPGRDNQRLDLLNLRMRHRLHLQI